MMLIGRQMWSPDVVRGMRSCVVNGRQVDVFDDAPRSMYDSLVASAQREGDRIAIVDDDGRGWTYTQLLDQVGRLATYLSVRGIGRGARIGLLLETSIEFCIAAYAINEIGGVMVPMPTKYRAPEVEALVVRSGCRIVLTEERYRGLLHEFTASNGQVICSDRTAGIHGFAYLKADGEGVVGGERRAEDDAILMYTSGTTSLSKGVVLTNSNVGHAIIAYQRILGVTSEDIGLLPVPIYYVTGLVALLGLFVHCGARIHLHRRFDARRVLTDVREHSITLIHASPTVFALLLGEAEHFPSLPSLRILACGAAHMPVSRIAALHSWLPGMSFRTVYGLTETTSPAFIMDCDAATSPHGGSSGLPIPGLSVRIVDEEGQDLGRGERGEILLYGTNILRRYDEGTATGLTSEGWLHTGDVGYVDEDGYVYVVDRLKDMINRGGEKVWSVDVEEELRRIPGIADAAVVGVPDEKYGEVPAAVAVLESGADLTSEQVIDSLRTRLASYQVPSNVRFCDEIPLTGNLKVDKKELRKRMTEASRSRVGHRV